MANKKETGLSIKGHSIVALVILLVGLPIATSYVMDVSRWFEGDTQKLHGPIEYKDNWSIDGHHPDDLTADWNNQTATGLTCPEGTAFSWMDAGDASFAVGGKPNASITPLEHCGWDGPLDYGGLASGTYQFVFGPPSNFAKSAEDDGMMMIAMTPCNRDFSTGPSSNAALGYVNCGYSDYQLRLPSNAFPTNTAMIGFNFLVEGSHIYGQISCLNNWQVSYDWELSIDGTVFADGSQKHWALDRCTLYKPSTGGGHPYIHIDTDLNVVQVAKYAELIKSAGQNPIFAMRVFNFYDETLGQSLSCKGWDMGCELANKWGKHTAFDGSSDVQVYYPHQCTPSLLSHVAATYPNECAMLVGLVVDTADFSGNDGFTLGLFTWGLGATFMIVAIASTRLWDPFKEKTKEVIVNG